MHVVPLSSSIRTAYRVALQGLRAASRVITLGAGRSHAQLILAQSSRASDPPDHDTSTLWGHVLGLGYVRFYSMLAFSRSPEFSLADPFILVMHTVQYCTTRTWGCPARTRTSSVCGSARFRGCSAESGVWTCLDPSYEYIIL